MSLARLGTIANLFALLLSPLRSIELCLGSSRTETPTFTSRQRLCYLSQSMYALVAYVGAVVQYSHEGYVVTFTFSSSLHATEGQRCILSFPLPCLPACLHPRTMSLHYSVASMAGLLLRLAVIHRLCSVALDPVTVPGPCYRPCQL